MRNPTAKEMDLGVAVIRTCSMRVEVAKKKK
jgi:hypothetical protein